MIPEYTILSAGGLADKLNPTRPCPYAGMLGISISNHYFSNSRVMGITQLGLRLCPSFTIVLFDYPERWNWPLKQGVTMAENERRCVAIGQEKKAGYTRELTKLGLEGAVKLLTWQNFWQDQSYLNNVAVISEEFERNPDFRAAVVAQLRRNLHVRLAREPKTDEEIAAMCHYLLEEIAGLFYLQFDKKLQLDFYPAPQMQVIQDIFSGVFPELGKNLGYDWKAQGWVEVGEKL